MNKDINTNITTILPIKESLEDSTIGKEDEIGIEYTNLVPPPFIPPPPKGVKKNRGGVTKPSPVQQSDSDKQLVTLKKEVDLVKKYNKELNVFRKTKIEQAEYKVLKKLPSIIEKVIEQALRGDLQASKLLLDRVIPVKKALDEGGVQVSKGGVINITVNASGESPVQTLISNEQVVEDGEYEEME